jgi:hypothetical protein
MCVAFIPMHLVVLECKRFKEMHLGAVLIFLRIFRIFLELILIFLEIFLFIKWL